MKKIIITACVSILLTLGCVFLANKLDSNKNNNLIVERGIKDVKEVDYTLPKFVVSISGIYDSTLTNEDIKDLKTYEIAAVMDESYENEYHTYKGVKMLDILNYYGIDDFNKVYFRASGKLQVEFSKEEITDDMYFVFTKDGKSIKSGESGGLLIPSINARYSITDVVTFSFE